MNDEKALEIIGDYIQPDGGLYCLGHYMAWTPGDKTITLDCGFEVEELEAIAWWMRHTSNKAKASKDDADLDDWREVARLLFNALGRYTSEIEKEKARVAYFEISNTVVKERRGE
jgi:hypothetical protein